MVLLNYELLVTAALSYLLGSIPFGYILVRIFRGEDVRRSGSGNIGATNVSRRSPALGVLTLLLDALKGSAAVASDPAGFVIIGICYVDGYCCAIRLAWPHVSRLVEVPWRQRSRGRPGFI